MEFRRSLRHVSSTALIIVAVRLFDLVLLCGMQVAAFEQLCIPTKASLGVDITVSRQSIKPSKPLTETQASAWVLDKTQFCNVAVLFAAADSYHNKPDDVTSQAKLFSTAG